MVKKILSKIKSTKNGGAIFIETIVCVSVVIMVFCAIADMYILSKKNSAIQDIGKEITRTLSVQGGARNDAPAGYAGDYYNTNLLGDLVRQQMAANGFKDGDWNIDITYNDIVVDLEMGTMEEKTNAEEQKLYYFEGSTYIKNETKKIDYLQNFTVTVNAKNDWTFLQSFFGKRRGTLSISFPGTSEVKWDYDAWGSEV